MRHLKSLVLVTASQPARCRSYLSVRDFRSIIVRKVKQQQLSSASLKRTFDHHATFSSGDAIQLDSDRRFNRMNLLPDKIILHWKGEAALGYSSQFRHVEFIGALSAVLGSSIEELSAEVCFHDALSYTGTSDLMTESQISEYNQAMQYVTTVSRTISRQQYVDAAKRSSLVHALYEVVARTHKVGTKDALESLAQNAIDSTGLDDLKASDNTASWCLRVRHYGAASTKNKEGRYGGRARSFTKEQDALQALKPLLIQFSGKVNLLEPDVKLYVFDGLTSSSTVLARRLTCGPKISILDPVTRICVTNTPLCPIAAFALCNVAGITPHCAILDPYAGSGTILLAAALIEPTCQTVGIEIAHNGIVNRNDIYQDFVTRGLTPPRALIKGDSTNIVIRGKAREALGENTAFDFVIADPPYGIRESTIEMNPLQELLKSIRYDCQAGQRLLKIGGKLVCFVPCTQDNVISQLLPSEELLQHSGLRFELAQEQPLNSKLSRWLVSFLCVA